jgi:hypothetical protein
VKHLVNGTGANAARRPITAPAPTIHFGARLNTVTWIEVEDSEDEDLTT